MAILKLKPQRGGFNRPFGCGWFIREFLLGHGPEGSTAIDSDRGATQTDINFEYKEALARAAARERAERIVSDMVLSKKDVTEREAEKIYQHELKKFPRKSSHMRYHSFLMYFGVLKRLGWVEPTGETEASTFRDIYPEAPGRVYFRLTEKGRATGTELWSNPLFVLYPGIGPRHQKSS